VDRTVNIDIPLTALLCFRTIPKIDSSNNTINSIWLYEQQAVQMCNFGRKQQRYLAASVATGVSHVNIRLLPFSTSADIIFLHYSLI